MIRTIDILAKIGSAAFGLLFVWEGATTVYALVRRR